MIKLADTKEKYSIDPIALQQFDDIFGDVSRYVLEFDPFWDAMLPQAIQMHSRYGMGVWAGSGCVDYNEAKALYIFTRTYRPKIVIELGYAGGVSTSFIAHALAMNMEGVVHTVDLSPEYWDVCPMFAQYKAKEIIVQYHSTDAIQFLDACRLDTTLTFTDATHDREPTERIATLLKTKWPHAAHLYHEWGMSNVSGELEQSYVSMVNFIGTLYERDAFEHVFGETSRHGGFVGSCGLGVVTPL